MAVFRRVRRRGYFGPAMATGISLSVLLMAGCNRSGDTTASDTNSEPVSNAAAKAPAAAKSDATDPEKGAAAVIAELDNAKPPPKKVVRHTDYVALWEADSSKPSSDKDDVKPLRMRRRVAEFSDGSAINDGHYTEWYAPPGHQKMEEGDYVDGVRQGKWTLWHENGKVRRVENFVNGKLEGSWKQYRDDGTLESEQSYKNNLRDGKWVAYDSTGKHIDAECEYKAGVFGGLWTYYYDEDDAKRLVDAGKLTKDEAAALIEKRQKRVEQHFKDSQPEGDMTSWYPNGKIETIKHYKNGRLDGEEIVYKETGEELRRRHWSGGQLVSTTSPPSN